MSAVDGVRNANTCTYLHCFVMELLVLGCQLVDYEGPHSRYSEIRTTKVLQRCWACSFPIKSMAD